MTDSTNEDTAPGPKVERRPLIWSFRITDERVGDVWVFTLAGRLAAAEAARLQARIDEAIAAGNRRVVLDMNAIDYVSSRGVDVLDTAAARCYEAGGRLVLAAVADPVRIVLELTRSAERLAIEPTRAAAVARAAVDPGPDRPTQPGSA